MQPANERNHPMTAHLLIHLSHSERHQGIRPRVSRGALALRGTEARRRDRRQDEARRRARLRAAALSFDVRRQLSDARRAEGLRRHPRAVKDALAHAASISTGGAPMLIVVTDDELTQSCGRRVEPSAPPVGHAPVHTNNIQSRKPTMKLYSVHPLTQRPQGGRRHRPSSASTTSSTRWSGCTRASTASPTISPSTRWARCRPCATAT